MWVYRPEQFIEEGRTVSLFTGYRRGRPEPRHVHDFIEIIYVLEGKSRQYIDDQTYDVSHGDLLFINYGSTHAFEASQDYVYVNICFSPEVMSDGMITAENAFSLLSLTSFNEICNESTGSKMTFFGNERREVEDILLAMERESKEKQSSWTRVMENYLNILITKMLRKIEVTLKEQEVGDVWHALSDYIDSNLDAELTLATLAQKCFYNPSYFSRIFKEKFKMPLVEYVTRKRLDHAVRLLCESELSIDEISERVGFSDRSGFYRAFSKYLGGTPSEYRNANAKVKKSDK